MKIGFGIFLEATIYNIKRQTQPYVNTRAAKANLRAEHAAFVKHKSAYNTNRPLSAKVATQTGTYKLQSNH